MILPMPPVPAAVSGPTNATGHAIVHDAELLASMTMPSNTGHDISLVAEHLRGLLRGLWHAKVVKDDERTQWLDWIHQVTRALMLGETVVAEHYVSHEQILPAFLTKPFKPTPKPGNDLQPWQIIVDELPASGSRYVEWPRCNGKRSATRELAKYQVTDHAREAEHALSLAQAAHSAGDHKLAKHHTTRAAELTAAAWNSVPATQRPDPVPALPEDAE